MCACVWIRVRLIRDSNPTSMQLRFYCCLAIALNFKYAFYVIAKRFGRFWFSLLFLYTISTRFCSFGDTRDWVQMSAICVWCVYFVFVVLNFIHWSLIAWNEIYLKKYTFTHQMITKSVSTYTQKHKRRDTQITQQQQLQKKNYRIQIQMARFIIIIVSSSLFIYQTTIIYRLNNQRKGNGIKQTKNETEKITRARLDRQTTTCIV